MHAPASARKPWQDRSGESLLVDAAFVEQQLAGIAKNADLSRYVL